jgi:hypothetical protein
MRDVTTTAVGASSALSLFGVQELLFVARGNTRPAMRRLRRLTRDVSEQLDAPAKRAFELGDRCLAALVDLASCSACLDYRSSIKSAINVTGPLVELIQMVFPNRLALRYQETYNKHYVLDLVQNAHRHLDIRHSDQLPDLVEAAYDCDPYDTLWLLEGIGYHYTRECLYACDSPVGLLHEMPGNDLPDESLCMLHAGMGMAFAETIVQSLGTDPLPCELTSAASRFESMCKSNSRQGYLGASFEALGLVVQMFCSHIVPGLDGVLSQTYSPLRTFFWHGIGRCVYLVSEQRTLSQFADHDYLISDASAISNKNAGIGWAATLVNMRQPEIFLDFIQRVENDFDALEATVLGIATAIAMRRATTPASDLVDSFCTHLGASTYAAPELHQIQKACEAAGRVINECGQNRQLGELFHLIGPDSPKGSIAAA